MSSEQRAGAPMARPAGAAMVSLYEKQVRIYPRAVSGWFAAWRWALVALTQAVFYGLPWLSWNGRQAVLFDLEARRFFVFGLVLHPQDFIYLAALLVLSALALFFFTAVAGRLWCGYACPQTVYTEMFMWVERRIEGDRIARMRLDAAPWHAAKLARKGAKQAAWIAIALVTGFSFVGYFTPVRALAAEALALSFSPWEWFWVLFYAFATYGNAGWMREQVCKYMCPYARFQSALIDRDSMIITYDAGRGEGRGSRARSADRTQLAAQGLGDCIDCTLCVQVCPTGIDIRNGLQNECIGCAACIDVCNTVMDKMDYPRGLIRYSTENGVVNRLSRRQMLARLWRPRVLIYGALLAATAIAFITSLALRAPMHLDVIKDRNALARQAEDGRLENAYLLQLMNSTEVALPVQVRVSGLAGANLAALPAVTVPPAGLQAVAVRVQLPPEAAQRAGPGAHPIVFEVLRSDGQPQASARSMFYVPR